MARQVEERRQLASAPPRCGIGNGSMPAGLRKRTGGSLSPAILQVRCRPHASLVGEIEIDVTLVLRDANMDHPLGCFKLRPRLEQIERGVEGGALGASRVASK